MFFNEFDHFSIKTPVTEKDIKDIHDKTIEFVEQNKQGPIRKITDDINHIEVEHSVKRVRFGYY